MIYPAEYLKRWAAKYERLSDVPLPERIEAHQAAIALLRNMNPDGVKKEALS